MMESSEPTIGGGAKTTDETMGKQASYNGHGILEALDIIRIIENAGIACCIVGGRALRYYGVPRVASVSSVPML